MITLDRSDLAPGSVVSFTGAADGWTVRFTGDEDVTTEEVIGWAVVVHEPRELEDDSALIETGVEPVLLVGRAALCLSAYMDRHLADGWRGGVAIQRDRRRA